MRLVKTVACSGLLLWAVAGCASPSPSPTLTAANLQRVCEQLNRPAALDCHQALAVAVAALPPGDRPIRATFHYGTYCAMTSGCGFSAPANRVDFGLVTFSYAGNAHQEYIYVVADVFGRLRLGSTLSAFPPPLMSVPTPIP
jgi:hypothetical protein